MKRAGVVLVGDDGADVHNKVSERDRSSKSEYPILPVLKERGRLMMWPKRSPH